MLSHSAFLAHTAGAFRRTYIYTGIVASPCTSPRQRTGAPPHSNESVRPQALLHQASCLLAAMQSRHAHATTMHMPQPAPSTCFLRPAHVACGCIIHGRLFYTSLSASCFSSSNRTSAHMYMTSLHVSLTPPSFLIQLAPSGAPIYITGTGSCVAVYHALFHMSLCVSCTPV